MLPAFSIAELLRLSAAVEARSRGAFGTQTDFAVRGGGFGQVVVMVDGVRLNDSQSGHHNGDIPVAIDRIDRIEIVRGTGSSLFGADAVTGTINIITGAPATRATLSGGQYGLVRGAASATVEPWGRTTALDGWLTRSAGFMPDRELLTGGLALSTALTPQRRLAVSHLRNAFGANGFYGASPSKEWTDQTLVSFADRIGTATRHVATRAAYRTHGDHFLWDIARPGFAENRHRTHALTAATTFRTGGERNWASASVEGGVDTIRSNNLGDHTVQHVAALLEVQRGIGRRATIYPGLRYDALFGVRRQLEPVDRRGRGAVTFVRVAGVGGPGVSRPDVHRALLSRSGASRPGGARAGTRLGVRRRPGLDAGRLGRRAHAVRAPRDRRHRLGATVGAGAVADGEHPPRARPTASKPAPAGRGAAASSARNIRGSTQRRRRSRSSRSTSRITRATRWPSPPAPNSVHARRLGFRSDCKRKIDGRAYCGADLRASRRVGTIELLFDATNLFDVSYQEVKGVDMPPRTLSAGVRIGK